jgi:hypothetical protein
MNEELESVLKDYRDNERDIQMCQLAMDGHWSTVSYPKGLLVQCIEMRPLIAKKIIELGGQVPVEPDITEVIQERDALRAEVQRLEKLLSSTVKRLDDKCAWHFYWCDTTHGTGMSCDCGGSELIDQTRPYADKPGES